MRHTTPKRSIEGFLLAQHRVNDRGEFLGDERTGDRAAFAPLGSQEFVFDLGEVLNRSHRGVMKRHLYRDIKRFYGIRSRLVHGGTPDHGEIDPTADMFQLVSSILERVLMSAKLAQTFNDESRRRVLLESLVFGH